MSKRDPVLGRGLSLRSPGQMFPVFSRPFGTCSLDDGHPALRAGLISFVRFADSPPCGVPAPRTHRSWDSPALRSSCSSGSPLRKLPASRTHPSRTHRSWDSPALRSSCSAGSPLADTPLFGLPTSRTPGFEDSPFADSPLLGLPGSAEFLLCGLPALTDRWFSLDTQWVISACESFAAL